MFEKSFQSRASPGETVKNIRTDVQAPTPSYGLRGVEDAGGAGGEGGLSALALHAPWAMFPANTHSLSNSGNRRRRKVKLHENDSNGCDFFSRERKQPPHTLRRVHPFGSNLAAALKTQWAVGNRSPLITISRTHFFFALVWPLMICKVPACICT